MTGDEGAAVGHGVGGAIEDGGVLGGVHPFGPVPVLVGGVLVVVSWEGGKCGDTIWDRSGERKVKGFWRGTNWLVALVATLLTKSLLVLPDIVSVPSQECSTVMDERGLVLMGCDEIIETVSNTWDEGSGGQFGLVHQAKNSVRVGFSLGWCERTTIAC